MVQKSHCRTRLDLWRAIQACSRCNCIEAYPSGYLGRGALVLETVSNLVLAVLADLSNVGPPGAAVLDVGLLSAIASYILTGFTVGHRLITLPVFFLCLGLAGIFAIHFGRGVQLSGTTELQATLILAMAGELVAGFLLLLLFARPVPKMGRS